MSSTKCSQCGLANFRSAEHCKRCKASLSAPSASSESPSSPTNAVAPAAPTESLSSPDAVAPSADNFERLNASYYVAPATPARRRGFSPLRVLLVVFLIVGPVYYPFHKMELERAERLKVEIEMQRQWKEYGARDHYKTDLERFQREMREERARERGH